MKILVATRNPAKLREIRALFRIPTLDLLGSGDVIGVPEVAEDGDTFEVNAVKKAVELAGFSGLWTLADDSGLEVDALGGRPGVWSARFAGEPVNVEANNRKLLKAMEKAANRRARFRCVIALASPGGRFQTVEGKCDGEIADAPRGGGGFGYDPVFVPDGFQATFAEMSPAEKNLISHRAAALKLAVRAWGNLLSQETPPSDFQS